MKIFKHFLKRKILLCWYSIGCNFGDYYIYRTVKRHIERWGYRCVEVEVGLQYKEIVKIAQKSDFLWFAGGGIIERWIPNVINNFGQFHNETEYIRYGVTGLSIGAFDYSDKKASLKYWVNNSSFFYTRDYYSAKELNRLAESKKAINSTDVVFAYEFEKRTRYFGHLHTIGINFRDLPYPDLSGQFNWDGWNEAIRKIDARVVGIPDQYDCSSRVCFDMPLIYSPDNVLRIISECDIVIAMRFHVILVAAKMGKIPIPINYCPKVGRLAEQLGISKLVLSVDDPGSLNQKICDVVANKEVYLDEIKRNIGKCEELIRGTFNTIHECLTREI